MNNDQKRNDRIAANLRLMIRRSTALIGIAAAMLSVASGCTWQQAYSAGQTWQRNACNRTVEQTERERCLSNTNMTYEDYRRQVEAKKE